MADTTLRESFVTGSACAVYAVCANAEAQCWACVFPSEGMRPSEYVPRDPTIEHPITTALKAARKADRKRAKQSDASRRGTANRRKGQRVERDFAKLTGGQRVPLSGALRGNLSNDVALPPSLGSLKVEVKYRSSGLATLYKWVLDEVERPDAVVVKMPNQPFLVIQTYAQWEAGRQPSPVDLKKLAEAQRLLEEAIP